MELFNWFKRKNKSSFTISDVSIPPKVKRTADLYPILYHIPGNVAAGEIKKFTFRNESIYYDIGKRILITETTYNPVKDWYLIWVHVGNDYYKLIAKS